MASSTNTVFSTTLQQLRKQKGVTQEQLANHLGVSAQAVSKWENGSYPEGDLLPKISEFFGVSISYLYGQEKETVSLEQEVLNELSEIIKKHEESNLGVSSHPEYFDKMFDIAWAFQVGAWKNNKVYWKRNIADNDMRTGSAITNDEGFTFMNLNRGNEFFVMAREAEEGFAKQINITNRTRLFYALLGKPGALEVILYVLTLKPSEYVTAETISQNTGVKKENVVNLLNEIGEIVCDKCSNPPFRKIEVLGIDKSQQAYSIDMTGVSSYVMLFLVTDIAINSVNGYQMQIGSRMKSYLERETAIKIIKELKENGKTV